MFDTTTIKSFFKNHSVKMSIQDIKLSFVVMFIAGCGLIYQYLLASYSSRVIGSMETVIFTVITIMILSMGAGSFFARYFKDKFVAFSILESVIGVLAVCTIFLISGTNALSNQLHIVIAETFNIPVHLIQNGDYLKPLKDILGSTTYIMSAILGLLIGMEIPLIASIREEIYNKEKLDNNIGVIYGIDYVGAGIGAFIWILVLMKIEMGTALAIVATTNVVVGFLFIFLFRKYFSKLKLVLTVQILTTIFIWAACTNLNDWEKKVEGSLYADEMIFSKNTQYQRIAITKGVNPFTKEENYSFFINGKTQFSESDEGIYHSFLVYPALMAAGMPKEVLIIGGGDGLAARDVLKTNPNRVTLLDLDKEIVEFFKTPYYEKEGNNVNQHLIELNQNSFNDKRMELIFGDAYLNVQELIKSGRKYGAIIVDLPDPSHPDLNKLFSVEFYSMLNMLLADSGAISVQSTSPYLAKSVFISIGKTLHESGFTVEQYKENIPSFGGMWGWNIAVKNGKTAKERIANYDELPFDDEYMTKENLMAAFTFGKNYYKGIENIKVNRINNQVMYNYYLQSWQKETKTIFE